MGSMTAEFAFDRPPIALTVAGSDSGGGAGIQADLKTFGALGCYGASVIVAVTAQNTLGVLDACELPISNIAAQIDAVANDLHPDVVKTGMLSSAEIVTLVADKFNEHKMGPIVVDPVMVSETGAQLIAPEAVRLIVERLIPIADVVTPNAYEAEALTGVKVTRLEDLYTAARAMLELGANCVIVKGGHIEGNAAIDLLLDDGGFQEFSAQRVDTANTHGTGCTFASALAAQLAFGMDVRKAADSAKRYVTDSIINSFPVGSGKGPLSHFGRWWRSSEGPYFEEK